MNNIFIFLFTLIILISCDSETVIESVKLDKAQEIISTSIASSGGATYESSSISFTFRDKEYKGNRSGNEFNLKRSFQDSLGKIEDSYSNNDFIRMIEGQKVMVPDTMVGKYEESINSVFYFALLPYKLDDASVIKKYLGEKEVKGKVYHKIQVNFEKEGGGTDFDDNYIYWINKETNFIDYLAYDYTRDEGGMRFRVNYNERVVNGIRFADAINMKPKVKGSVVLQDIDLAFENDELTELSKIILENVNVQSN